MGTFTFLAYSMQGALLSLHIIHVLKMTGLLRRTFFFNEQQSKYAFLFDQ
jgi:hypothetical protein